MTAKDSYYVDTRRVDHHFMELKTLAIWLFHGSMFLSGLGNQIGLGDQAVSLLARGKEESVLQVQLAVSSFGGTNIESKQ